MNACSKSHPGDVGYFIKLQVTSLPHKSVVVVVVVVVAVIIRQLPHCTIITFCKCFIYQIKLRSACVLCFSFWHDEQFSRNKTRFDMSFM
jgi:hypothetical protein